MPNAIGVPRPPVDLHNPVTFERLVTEALDDIPAEFGRYLENVAVLVEDEPPRGLLQRIGLDPQRDTLFGLYEGVPLPRRPHDFAGAPPDRIRIFRGPLLRHCRTAEELQREVRHTVVHEIAHFFGFDEDAIRKLGY